MDEEKIVDLEKIIKKMPGDLVKAIEAAKESWAQPSTQKRIEKYSERMKRMRRNDLYLRSGMSDTDIEIKTFETFEVFNTNREAHFLVQAYLDAYPISTEEGRGLIIMGGVGVGKTHLCLALLVELIRRHDVYVKYANIKTTLDMEKASFDGHGPGPLDSLKRVGLLFLDDLGSERATEWTVDAVSTLVTYRYVKYLPTIFTTNCLGFGALLNSLSGTWGEITAERIVDRIRERNEAVLIKGKTRRKRLVSILRDTFR